MTGAGDESVDLLFGGAYALSESSEAALEDYARAVAQAGEAEALRKDERSDEGPGSSGPERAKVHGVRLVAPQAAASPEVTRDVEDFARALAQDGRNDRLGWS
jgi:hypothetical protein